MAEETKTLITDSCEACGADVRPESLFCYNCGGSLEKTEHTAKPAPSEPLPEVNSSNGSGSVPAIKEGPGLPTAASIRKQSKGFRRKPVEFVWEPVEETSDRVLLLVSVALLVFSLVVTAIALYIK